jgi:competence protein ComEA
LAGDLHSAALPAHEERMDRIGEWRLVEAQPEEAAATGGAKTSPAANEGGSVPWRLMALLGAAAIAVVGVSIWLTLPAADVSVAGNGGAFVLDPTIGGNNSSVAGRVSGVASAAPVGSILVDVEGAVVDPGLHQLGSGSRLGDAIAAAGGYSTEVDIAAAADELNLAETLNDGAKIHVPARGEAAAQSPHSPASGGSSPPNGGGLIDINHATADELDTLPGVGPVTAGKIITAREQAPFGTIDELLSRGIVGQSTYDKLSALVTVSP